MSAPRVRPDAGELRVRRLDGERSLAGLARRLGHGTQPLAWLDSSQRDTDRGRLSVLCQLSGDGFVAGRSCRPRDAQDRWRERIRSAFARQRPAPALLPASDALPFVGGWIGYLAYEAQVDMDAAFPGRDAVLPYPRVWFKRADRGVTVDHAGRRTVLWCRGTPDRAKRRFDAWQRVLDGDDERPPRPPAKDGWQLQADELDGAGYESAVRDILERIRAGEVYQVNLTTPVRVRSGRDPLNAYLALRDASPADFSAYLDWPGLRVLATSPEQFLELRAGRIVARPMKGTRPRSADPSTDDGLRRELALSPKDRAENLMIVDLVRNDLGRVAEVGSVAVSHLFRVERYATVHQMTSQVEGHLARGQDIFSLLAATFPPGSMTGAPKVQATRVIRRLETRPRGLYSGCLGFIDWRGDASFNVVIRTLVADRRGGSWAVGGGIVADSDPTDELREAGLKLEALRLALRPGA